MRSGASSPSLLVDWPFLAGCATAVQSAAEGSMIRPPPKRFPSFPPNPNPPHVEIGFIRGQS